MGEWRITGRISPCEDGALDVDLVVTKSSPARSTPLPRVKAMTADDIAATIDLAKEGLSPALIELAAQMVDLMASQNKGGSVSLGRALREVWAPLAKAAGSGSYSLSSLEWGMQQAVAKSVPNVNYAKKAASGFTEDLPASGTVAAQASRYDTIGRDFDGE